MCCDRILSFPMISAQAISGGGNGALVGLSGVAVVQIQIIELVRRIAPLRGG